MDESGRRTRTQATAGDTTGNGRDPDRRGPQARSDTASETSTAAPAGSSSQAADVDGQTALGLYFREMAATAVMTPKQEHAAAEQIFNARVAQWRAILTYPPFSDAIAALISTIFPPDVAPIAELDAVLQSSRRYRDRQTRVHDEAFTASAEQLARAMAKLDTDGDASEPIAADLHAILRGAKEGLKLQVTLPPQGSAPFRRYVESVETAGLQLWRNKDQFVRANLRLVVTMARRYNRGTLPLPDLIQEGNIGLMKAVDRFDPTRGFRFSTYASWWIRHAISRGLADKGRQVRVPVHMIDVYHKLKRNRQRFSTVHGREPTDEELADAAGIPLEKIERLRQCLLESGSSLDAPVAGGEGRTVGELIEDESLPMPSDALLAQSMGDKLRELIETLRPIEADVLRKRFGLGEAEPMTLREIGEQYSLSRERIRQLQEQALTKIRRELRRQELI